MTPCLICGAPANVTPAGKVTRRCLPCYNEVRRKKYAEDEDYRRKVRCQQAAYYAENAASLIAKNTRYAKDQRALIAPLREAARAEVLASAEHAARVERRRLRACERAAAWARENPVRHAEGVARRRKERPEMFLVWSRNYVAKRRQAIPPWSDPDAVLRVYREAAELTRTTGLQWHVDHVVPLQSPLVCGLHCEANLQVVPAFANLSKSNRYWPDMPT